MTSPNTVKRLDNWPPDLRLRKALELMRDRLSAEFAVDRMVLFGSAARGTADEESDIDVLIVMKDRPDHMIRNRISRIILDVNLEYDTNLTGLVVDQRSWDDGFLSVLPLHEEIEGQGMAL